jgi:exopolysaccharide production protein ExoQ
MTFQTVETWFMILSMWFIIGNPINVLLYGESGGQEINTDAAGSLEPNIVLALYIISLVLMLPRLGQVLYHILKGNTLIWMMVILILASTAWSDFPDITLRRGLIVFGAACYGTYFATCFPFQKQIQIMATVFFASVVSSLVFTIVLPKYGIMSMPPHIGAWRGVYIHKQNLGTQMSLMSAFFLILLKSEFWREKKGLALLGVVLSIFLVLASKSSTGLISVALLATCIHIFQWRRFRPDILAFIVITAILSIGSIVIYLVDNAAAIVGVLGKDLTLSGRDQLWGAILQMVNQRPLLGYGYEAFWYVTGQSSRPDLIWNMIGWDAPHAHNGLLEILLGLGWVGAGLFLITFINNIWRSLQRIALNPSATSYCSMIFLIYIVLTNITEKNFFGSNLTWILYVWMGFVPIVQLRSQTISNHPTIQNYTIPQTDRNLKTIKGFSDINLEIKPNNQQYR